MEAVFWGAFGLVVYVYAGYPLALAVWTRVAARERRRTSDHLPPVSIVIAARNEASRLPQRIENLLALDYPADLLEIIVVSNGSTDRTAQALAPYVAAAPAAERRSGFAGAAHRDRAAGQGRGAQHRRGRGTPRHDRVRRRAAAVRP